MVIMCWLVLKKVNGQKAYYNNGIRRFICLWKNGRRVRIYAHIEESYENVADEDLSKLKDFRNNLERIICYSIFCKTNER